MHLTSAYMIFCVYDIYLFGSKNDRLLPAYSLLSTPLLFLQISRLKDNVCKACYESNDLLCQIMNINVILFRPSPFLLLYTITHLLDNASI